jgi:hypothetical protein
MNIDGSYNSDLALSIRAVQNDGKNFSSFRPNNARAKRMTLDGTGTVTLGLALIRFQQALPASRWKNFSSRLWEIMIKRTNADAQR